METFVRLVVYAPMLWVMYYIADNWVLKSRTPILDAIGYGAGFILALMVLENTLFAIHW